MLSVRREMGEVSEGFGDKNKDQTTCLGGSLQFPSKKCPVIKKITSRANFIYCTIKQIII